MAESSWVYYDLLISLVRVNKLFLVTSHCVGDLDLDKEELSPHMTQVAVEEIKGLRVTSEKVVLVLGWYFGTAWGLFLLLFHCVFTSYSVENA
ncbi:hypothetical protein TorRG33x02_038680 [Trema orientale]|uniref:Uncharacterized protein n=1 Tax=Trema orientale TaxID=63057 RepID=A0A2P5FRL5_TREOI|nr:hypothetical protein TorRG33x02_038680 [Trema orientale]